MKQARRQLFVQAWLEEVVSVGLFGRTIDEVVEHFVLEGLRRELQKGSITRTVQDARDGAEFSLLCQKYTKVPKS